MMPRLDGYQALSALKKNQLTMDIPVIMLTAKTDSMAAEIEKTFSAGADDYIRKPFQLAEVRARVRNLAARHLLMKERVSDLRNAAMVQKKFLTNSGETENVLKNAGLKAVFFNQPSNGISGDFWFPKKMPNGKAGLFVADTCGHGVLAAIISMRILSVIDHCSAPNLHPSEFLAAVNSDIYDLLSPEAKFVAGMYFIFDQQKLIFSNAGQPMPFLLREGKLIELKTSAPPLGVFSELTTNEIEHEFRKGDRLIIYTDGLFEGEAVNSETVPLNRVIACLEKNCSVPLADMTRFLISDMQACIKRDFDDDVTIIIIEMQ
ncbi:MAG: fused response regulator/phosphatase [Nitrospirae bacterium]|nr:fused response regulator/phosphatase [Nitrospirota bacterium]